MIAFALFPHFLDPVHSLWWPESGFNYAFFSSIGGCTFFTLGFFTYLRQNNCHTHRCWRRGKHLVAGGTYKVCTPCLRKIDPEHAGKHTLAHIAHHHRKAKESQ